jgi:hypothetical protein
MNVRVQLPVPSSSGSALAVTLTRTRRGSRARAAVHRATPRPRPPACARACSATHVRRERAARRAAYCIIHARPVGPDRSYPRRQIDRSYPRSLRVATAPQRNHNSPSSPCAALLHAQHRCIHQAGHAAGSITLGNSVPPFWATKSPFCCGSFSIQRVVQRVLRKTRCGPS